MMSVEGIDVCFDIVEILSYIFFPDHPYPCHSDQSDHSASCPDDRLILDRVDLDSLRYDPESCPDDDESIGRIMSPHEHEESESTSDEDHEDRIDRLIDTLKHSDRGEKDREIRDARY